MLRLALGGSDDTLRARRNWDLATDFFILKGCAESKGRMIGAATGLMYSSVVKWPSCFAWMSVSRKGSCPGMSAVSDRSMVNLIVGCTVFTYSKYSVRVSGLCGQTQKLSSM